MKFVHKSIGILAVGFLVLTFWSSLLYWPHKVCERGLMEITWMSARLSPSSELKNQVRFPEFSDQPVKESCVHSKITNLDFWGRLYRHSERSPYSQMFALPEIYFDDQTPEGRIFIYFDNAKGLFVQCRIVLYTDGKATGEILTYAGPNGMAKTSDKTLGQFCDIVSSPKMKTLDRLVVFDKKLHRFYRLNFSDNTVRASREYSLNSGYKPLAVDMPGIRSANIDITFDVSDKDKIFGNPWYYTSQSSLILDQTGRLYWFDLNKMEFAGQAGEVVNFDDVYACRIVPILWADSRVGLVVASAVIGGTTKMTQVVFNPDGQVYHSDEKTLSQGDLQDGSMFLVAKYLLENLYSPMALFGAYVQGVLNKTPVDEHLSPYLPLNTFLVQNGRETIESYSQYIGHLFVLITPALLLSSILAYRVRKNAISLGLSKPTCRTWFSLTFFFGLPAYITWRIVRPKEVMVTCKNCGKLRRPEFENCQHCKSLWHVPEITPPSWRVVESSEACDLPAEAMVKQA